MAQTDWVKISGYMFLLGILIAVVNGLSPSTIPSAGIILVVLGLAVGVLAALQMGSIKTNVTEIFLISTIALVAIGGSGSVFSSVPSIGTLLSRIISGIGDFVTPIAVIMALKALWDAAAVQLK